MPPFLNDQMMHAAPDRAEDAGDGRGGRAAAS